MTPTDLLDHAQALNRRGERYAMVTVVRITPPTSAYVGAQAIVTADGSLTGSVGGGCARDVVVAAALEAIQSGIARLVLISNAASGAVPAGVERHPMRCASDGEIELFIQPHTPAPLLLVLGNTPAAAQARVFAEQCGFRLTDSAAGAQAEQIAIALVATQGEDDETALQAALASPARQVLLIASRRKAQGLREAMRRRGVSEQRLAAIEAPAGPDIGAHSPAHIALAAVAGAVACWTRAAAVAPAAAPLPPSYVNPVCGIEVDPAQARHVVTYGGEQFYFCCDGCRLQFEQDPGKYFAIQAGHAMAAAAA
ncbi:XdhC family protein [Caenimonas terrae]|uniref:XdhC family protein n=1 Tax=Caenimonas terrae TaxID=696074 RepID=A0ABW0NLB6_9BURK